MSLLLTNEARIKKCIDKLYYKFRDSSLAAGIFPSNREIWNDIADDFTNHNFLVNEIVNLRKIAAAGEFLHVSHDEIFKTLFILLAKVK